MERLWEDLGFEVRVHSDLSGDEIRDVLATFIARDHSAHDAFVCFFLAHGELGAILASDAASVKVHDDIVRPFRASNCPGLAGKPKLFFFQISMLQRNEPEIVFLLCSEW